MDAILQKFFEAMALIVPVAIFFFWLGGKNSAKTKAELRTKLDSVLLDQKLQARKDEILKSLDSQSDADVVQLAIGRGNELLKRGRSKGPG